MQLTFLKRQPEKMEQRVKPGLTYQKTTHTHTVDKYVPNLSLNFLKSSPSQVTKKTKQPKPWTCEGMDPKKTLTDASVEMSIKKKMNMLGLMEKRIGTKLAMPEGYSVHCCRTKVGQDLLQDTPGFDLSAPYRGWSPWTYTGLHDNYLENYYNQPEKKKFLVKQDLITEEGYVLCSLEEFNQYIDYLKYINPKRDKLPQLDIRVSGKTVVVFFTSQQAQKRSRQAQQGVKPAYTSSRRPAIIHAY